MTLVRLRPLAEDDLLDRTRYYRREAGDEVAVRFFDSAIESLDAIGASPGLGSPLVGERCGVPGLRWRRIVGFPCGWYYFFVGQRVDVVRLLADMQDLGRMLGGSEPDVDY